MSGRKKDKGKGKAEEEEGSGLVPAPLSIGLTMPDGIDPPRPKEEAACETAGEPRIAEAEGGEGAPSSHDELERLLIETIAAYNGRKHLASYGDYDNNREEAMMPAPLVIKPKDNAKADDRNLNPQPHLHAPKTPASKRRSWSFSASAKNFVTPRKLFQGGGSRDTSEPSSSGRLSSCQPSSGSGLSPPLQSHLITPSTDDQHKVRKTSDATRRHSAFIQSPHHGLELNTVDTKQPRRYSTMLFNRVRGDGKDSQHTLQTSPVHDFRSSDKPNAGVGTEEPQPSELVSPSSHLSPKEHQSTLGHHRQEKPIVHYDFPNARHENQPTWANVELRPVRNILQSPMGRTTQTAKDSGFKFANKPLPTPGTSVSAYEEPTKEEQFNFSKPSSPAHTSLFSENMMKSRRVSNKAHHKLLEPFPEEVSSWSDATPPMASTFRRDYDLSFMQNRAKPYVSPGGFGPYRETRHDAGLLSRTSPIQSKQQHSAGKLENNFVETQKHRQRLSKPENIHQEEEMEQTSFIRQRTLPTRTNRMREYLDDGSGFILPKYNLFELVNDKWVEVGDVFVLESVVETESMELWLHKEMKIVRVLDSGAIVLRIPNDIREVLVGGESHVFDRKPVPPPHQELATLHIDRAQAIARHESKERADSPTLGWITDTDTTMVRSGRSTPYSTTGLSSLESSGDDDPRSGVVRKIKGPRGWYNDYTNGPAFDPYAKRTPPAAPKIAQNVVDESYYAGAFVDARFSRLEDVMTEVLAIDGRMPLGASYKLRPYVWDQFRLVRGGRDMGTLHFIRHLAMTMQQQAE